MVSICRNAGFTYDNLSESRPEPLWTGLATLVTVGCLMVVALASDGQPVQASIPNEVVIQATIDDGQLAEGVAIVGP